MASINCDPVIKALVVIITIGGLIAGCSTPVKRDEILKEARVAYIQAQANPNTAELEELSEAKQALEKAETAKTAEEMKHLAYLAKQKAQIALTVAERQAADKQGKQLAKQRELALIEAGKNEEIAAQKALREEKLAAQKASRLQLQNKLADLRRHRTGRLTIILDDVFETNQTDLQPQTIRDIETVAAFFNQYREFKVSVEGHTDNNGTHQHNLGLSERRATSVKFALIERGVTSTRIIVKGFGGTHPIASNRTKAGQQKNHRVELVIYQL